MGPKRWPWAVDLRPFQILFTSIRDLNSTVVSVHLRSSSGVLAVVINNNITKKCVFDITNSNFLLASISGESGEYIAKILQILF